MHPLTRIVARSGSERPGADRRIEATQFPELIFINPVEATRPQSPRLCNPEFARGDIAVTADIATEFESGLLELPLSAVDNATHDAIVVVDSRQYIVALNEAAASLFGYARTSIIGRALSCLVPENQRAQHAQQIRDFEASGQIERRAFGHDAIRGLRSNGLSFPAEISISRVELPVDGHCKAYFVAIIRDLSAKPGRQFNMMKLAERLRKALDLMPMAVWLVERERISYANQAAVDLFQVAGPASLVGKSIYEVLSDNSTTSLREHLARARHGSSPADRFNGTIVRPDGDLRAIEIASALWADHPDVVIQMAIIDVTRSWSAAQEQAQHSTELRRLTANVVEAREEERHHIARELHDELGQRLIALKMELSSLRGDLTSHDADQRIATMLEMASNTLAALRRIAANLRPLMLDDLGLSEAIESLARDVAAHTGIEVTTQIGVDDSTLAPGVDIALYRVVQEALTNVGRHARATDARIELRQDGGELVLTVHDNGRGFPEHSPRHDGRYGLLGIRERAFMLGGRLDVDNPPGGGGRITVRLPLKQSTLAGGTAA